MRALFINWKAKSTNFVIQIQYTIKISKITLIRKFLVIFGS